MNDARLTLRIPRELVFKLQKEAEKDQRSLNSYLKLKLESLVKNSKKPLRK